MPQIFISIKIFNNVNMWCTYTDKTYSMHAQTRHLLEIDNKDLEVVWSKFLFCHSLVNIKYRKFWKDRQRDKSQNNFVVYFDRKLHALFFWVLRYDAQEMTIENDGYQKRFLFWRSFVKAARQLEHQKPSKTNEHARVGLLTVDHSCLKVLRNFCFYIQTIVFYLNFLIFALFLFLSSI